MLRRVAVIQAGRAAGIPLASIGAALSLLPADRPPSKRDWARLSRAWRRDVEERIALLERVRDDLASCIGCGCLSLRSCRLFNPVDRAAQAGPGARYLLGDEPPAGHTRPMRPERMNAFSDGVIAILITILVLELRPPAGHHLTDILDEKGKLLAYVLSFVMVGIYWNNHHHLMQIVDTIDGRTLWANMHLLFWLSLTPLTTAWLGEAGVETGPGRRLRDRPARLRDRVHAADAGAARAARVGLAARAGDRQRPQGQGLARGLRPRSRVRVRAAVGLDRAVRRRGDRLVRPGPPRRARARRLTGGDDAQRLRVGHVDDIAGRSLRPRRPSGSPLTATVSVPIRFFASPPVSTTPASCSSWPRAMNSPVTSTSRTQAAYGCAGTMAPGRRR